MKDELGLELPPGLQAILHQCTKHEFKMFTQMATLYEHTKAHDCCPDFEQTRQELVLDIREKYSLKLGEYNWNYGLVKKAYEEGWGHILGCERLFNRNK